MTKRRLSILPADCMPDGFWAYQSSFETPTLGQAIEAGAIRADTSHEEWDKVSPGFKREIVRSARRISMLTCEVAA